jgi:hypothetical protein
LHAADIIAGAGHDRSVAQAMNCFLEILAPAHQAPRSLPTSSARAMYSIDIVQVAIVRARHIANDNA